MLHLKVAFPESWSSLVTRRSRVQKIANDVKPSAMDRVAVADLTTTALDLGNRRRGTTNKLRNDVFGDAPKYDMTEHADNWLMAASIGTREPAVTSPGPRGSTQIAIFHPSNLRLTYRAVNLASQVSAQANTIPLLEAMAMENKHQVYCAVHAVEAGWRRATGFQDSSRSTPLTRRGPKPGQRQQGDRHAYHQKKRYEQNFGETQRLNRHDNDKVEAAAKDIGIKGFNFSHAVDFVEDDDQDDRRPPAEGSHGITAVLRENAGRVNILPSGPHAAEIEEGNKIVLEMLEDVFGKGCMQTLPQTPDGMFCPFLADSAKDFNFEKLRGIFEERQVRTRV